MASEFNEKLDEMEHLLAHKDQIIKDLSCKTAELQLECITLKDINLRLKDDLS